MRRDRSDLCEVNRTEQNSWLPHARDSSRLNTAHYCISTDLLEALAAAAAGAAAAAVSSGVVAHCSRRAHRSMQCTVPQRSAIQSKRSQTITCSDSNNAKAARYFTSGRRVQQCTPLILNSSPSRPPRPPAARSRHTAAAAAACSCPLQTVLYCTVRRYPFAACRQSAGCPPIATTRASREMVRTRL